MFRDLPESAVTIKVGLKNTSASYKVESVSSVRNLLIAFTELSFFNVNIFKLSHKIIP